MADILQASLIRESVRMMISYKNINNKKQYKIESMQTKEQPSM